MTVLFALVIVLFVALLIYQKDRIRQWINNFFLAKNTKWVVLITLLAVIALFYPRIHTQIRKLKQKLNP
jgi:hypothetical protein